MFGKNFGCLSPTFFKNAVLYVESNNIQKKRQKDSTQQI